MKSSYFNPEVHSLPFKNFKHCSVFLCGGMCCEVLSKFYNGELINCEDQRSGYENEIYNKQVGIIGSDCWKSCDWDSSINEISGISENIDKGKPTLLYLDKEYYLHNDHFVIAFALGNRVGNIQRIYIYDPNYVYKRHFCNNPPSDFCIDPNYINSTLTNENSTVIDTKSFLEVNFNKKTITLYPSGKKIDGFKWYGQNPTGIPVSYYTDEKDIQHSCDLKLISCSSPGIINTSPIIFHSIMITKDGNVPADLKLFLEPGKELYQNGSDIFPFELKNEFSPSMIHKGFQFGKGYNNRMYNVFQKYTPSNPLTISLKSNFIEKSLKLVFPIPRMKYFSAYIEGTEHSKVPFNYELADRQIIEVQGLDINSVNEVEKVPSSYSGTLPKNQISVLFTGPDWQSAIANGSYDLFHPVLYLGYIKSNVVLELIHNGLYIDAKSKMSTNDPLPLEKQFSGNTVKFTLPGGNQKLYDSNIVNTIHFDIKGGGISSAFSETINKLFQYRCLIIHEPLIHQYFINDTDVFAKYFEKLLIDIPHSYLGSKFEKRFTLELKKNPKITKKKLNKLFCEKFMRKFVNKIISQGNSERLFNLFNVNYQSFEVYRKDRINIIINKSKNFKELKRNFEILEDELRPLIGKALIDNIFFKKIIIDVLKDKWD